MLTDKSLFKTYIEHQERQKLVLLACLVLDRDEQINMLMKETGEFEDMLLNLSDESENFNYSDDMIPLMLKCKLLIVNHAEICYLIENSASDGNIIEALCYIPQERHRKVLETRI